MPPATPRARGRAAYVCITRTLILITGMALGYYIGRPVYWTLESRIHDFHDSVPNTATEVEEGLPVESVDVALADPDLSKDGVSKEVLGKGTEKDKVESASKEGVQPEEKEEAKEAMEDNAESISGDSSTESAPEGFAKGVRPIIHEGKPLSEKLKHEIWSKPEDTSIPPKEEFALRKEMVEFRAKDKVVVVTFANFAFMDFVTNWVRHLTDVGVYNILVGAMDTKILEGLYLEGVPVFDMESGMSTIDVGWGTPIFHKMGREKITLINVFLSMNYELLICDTDMVWLQNPLPWIQRWPAADVLTSSDETIRTVNDDGLEHWEQAMAAYNIGILHYRPTAAAKAQAREWAELLASDDKIWDQNGFNDLMRRKLGPAVEAGEGLVHAYDGSLKLGIMPVALFCSGHTYFVQKLYKTVGLQPYAVHTTFQFAGTPGKRHRLREAKHFYDPPEYYDPPGGVLSFVPDIPDALLTGGEHTLESHFALVVYQLVRIRAALAIATILNRTLVFPELWCRFDRMWYPHPGILAGTATPQPLLCPLDHVFEIYKMLERDDFPEAEFGPTIPFREYSFLDNPRVPDSVSSSRLSVTLCSVDDSSCPRVPEPPGIGQTLLLPKNSSQNEIVDLLSPFKDVKILEFSSMTDAFGGWDDKEREKKFVWRIKQYVGIWCCVDKHPGHIWYDFFADKKPGYKPKPPKDWQEDHPPM